MIYLDRRVFDLDRGHIRTLFLVNDRVKQIAYRVVDPTAAPLLGRSSSPIAARLWIESNPSALGR